MLFTYDTDLSLRHAAALANTGPGLGAEHREGLPDLAAMGAWFDRWTWTGRRPTTPADLRAIHDLRPRLVRLWALRDDELADETNSLLAEGDALPRLVRHDGLGWHVHATSDDAPFHQRITVETGMAMVDVLRAGEQDRLKACAGEDCADLVIDLSRNRSRRFCEGTCGTRANVAAYRARRATSSN
ncbi:MAG: CGNR zinc finger domain-containing protein [Dermatophilaceae bacterium]